MRITKLRESVTEIMRIFPIVTAIVVTASLYLLIFERERLLSFAGRDASSARADMAPNTAKQSDAGADTPKENDTVANSAGEDETGVVSVLALRSQAKQIDRSILLRGRTEAARQVDVRAETSGLVNSAPLKKGASIKEGQLLCKIDPGTRMAALAEANSRLPEAKARLPEAEGRVLEAEARLKEARINDNAAKQLSEGGFASDVRVAGTKAAVQSALAAVETARAGVESAHAGILAAQAGIAAAQKEIDRLDIKAPFSGLLETDTAELGALMQPGGLCATIIQLDPIKLVAFASEKDVARIQIGATAQGRTTTGQTVDGRVTFLSRSSDPETRTFRTEITVENADMQLRDGQTAEIRIAAEGEKAHLLPASAMTLNDDGELGVQTALPDDGIAKFQPIKVLRDTADGVWVGGLPDTTAVIVVGQEYVTDGGKIAITYQETKS